jgi:hypothetical protein
MNNLIIHPEYSNLRNKLETLKIIITEKIAKKDYLIFHECKHIETVYMLKLGHLEFKIFEIKLNIRKIKREIQLIQKQINVQKKVDLAFIKKQIELEFEKYILELEEKGAKLNIAIKRSELKTLPKKDVIEIKKIYKELILKLHPDLNENISEKEKELLFQVMESYEDGNLEKLKVLKVLASDIPNILMKDDENIFDKLNDQINVLKINLELIDKEIREIKNSYPYNKKNFLSDKEKLEKYQEVLNSELNNYIETQAKYKKKLDNLLNSIDK